MWRSAILSSVWFVLGLSSWLIQVRLDGGAWVLCWGVICVSMFLAGWHGAGVFAKDE